MLIPNLWYTSNSRLAGLILDKSPNIQKHKLHLYGIPINPIISNIYIYPSTCLETVSTNHSKPTIDPIDLSACESYPQVVLLRPTFWWGETRCVSHVPTTSLLVDSRPTNPAEIPCAKFQWVMAKSSALHFMLQTQSSAALARMAVLRRDLHPRVGSR